MPRGPQGHPVIIQAGDSDEGREFAASSADVIFSRHSKLEEGRAFYRDVKRRLAAYGRRPEELKILPAVTYVLGDTEAEAAERAVEIRRAQVGPQTAIYFLEAVWGRDLSGYDPDGPLPDVEPDLDEGVSKGHAAFRRDRGELVAKWRALAEEKKLSIRELAIEVSAPQTFIGTPRSVADEIDHFVQADAADGFIFVPHLTPGGLDDLVDKVVPLLQEKGVFRADYTGPTLRDHLGLTPALRTASRRPHDPASRRRAGRRGLAPGRVAGRRRAARPPVHPRLLGRTRRGSRAGPARLRHLRRRARAPVLPPQRARRATRPGARAARRGADRVARRPADLTDRPRADHWHDPHRAVPRRDRHRLARPHQPRQAGWRPQISGRPDHVAHFGRRPPFPPQNSSRDRDPVFGTHVLDLFAEAGDAVEVVRRLWDSWEDDAEIRDVATGRFVDRDRLHHIDFRGEWFSVKGPSITPRSPQGQPPITSLAHDALSYEFAARSCDVVYVTPRDRDTAAAIVDSVRAAEAAVGRTEPPLRIFADLVVFLDSRDAYGRKARLDDLDGAELRSAELDWDAHVFTGTPEELAGLLLEWREAGLEGFRLRPGQLPHDLVAITRALVPALQNAGAFRTAYETVDLRGRLGLARPASRYAA
ncbi:hypothetical protein GCM10027612_43610 [Microbispora bryophytorum subsp. camponoti]